MASLLGPLYNILQNGTVIGTAEVKVVKATMSGLRIVTIKSNNRPRIGDSLTLSDQLSVEQQGILSEMQETEFTPGKLKKADQPKYDSPSDYYFAGKEAADNDYGSGSAFGGGLAAGLLGPHRLGNWLRNRQWSRSGGSTALFSRSRF